MPDLHAALEHHSAALLAAVEDLDGPAVHALVCCCASLIAVCSQQQERIAELSARVARLEQAEGNSAEGAKGDQP
jgi:hypothetical protein